jgi:hypothetical protein
MRLSDLISAATAAVVVAVLLVAAPSPALAAAAVVPKCKSVCGLAPVAVAGDCPVKKPQNSCFCPLRKVCGIQDDDDDDEEEDKENEVKKPNYVLPCCDGTTQVLCPEDKVRQSDRLSYIYFIFLLFVCCSTHSCTPADACCRAVTVQRRCYVRKTR